MRIEELTLNGFGKWAHASFSFAPGLNLIYADNEAGKSTLLEAMIGMLYGMKKDFLKKGVRREEWHRYLPWGVQQYGGAIHYRIGTQYYRIERDLLTEEHRLIDAEVLRDLSKDYRIDIRKERNYVYEQISLTRTLFEEVCRIKSIGIEHEQPLMEAMHQLAGQDIDGSTTYKEIFQLLEQRRRAIGKGDTGKDTRLAIVQQQLAKAKQELDLAKSRMKHFRALESEHRSLTSKLHLLEHSSEHFAQNMHSREHLQLEREQALLSRQQFSRFLEDMAQIQVEEEILESKLQEAFFFTRGNKPEAFAEDLIIQVRELEVEIKRCEDHAVQVDVEITRYEQLLSYFNELEHLEMQIERKHENKRPIRKYALLLALIGVGSIVFLPWYYGAGGIVIALLLYSSTLQSSQEQDLHRKRQDIRKRIPVVEELDTSKIRENLQSLIQQRETLYKQRVDYVHKISMLLEQKQLVQQLEPLSRRKQKLLFQLEPIRKGDHAFVEYWKTEYTQNSYNEDQFIEAWVDYLKKIDEQIGDITESLSKYTIYIEERDAILHAIARIEGEMNNYDALELVEQENRYARLLEEKQVWERKRDIIDLAKSIFQETLDEWNQQIAPSLNTRISDIFSLLTMRKYERVSADPSERFQLRVLDREHQAIRDQHQLSKGTEQQLYFALRFALIELYSHTYKLPIFLDDSFVHYDQQRLGQALLYLGEISKQHQVFLFTCHAREQELLESREIDFHKVLL